MKYLPLLLLTFLFNTGYAQQQNEYSKADAIISTIPDSSRNSTTSIARFIEVHFNNPNERARAIFVWLANNIQYDVANMYNVNFNLNALEIINKTLMEKKAICQGYAEVYHDIAEKLGIKNYVI